MRLDSTNVSGTNQQLEQQLKNMAMSGFSNEEFKDITNALIGTGNPDPKVISVNGFDPAAPGEFICQELCSDAYDAYITAMYSVSLIVVTAGCAIMTQFML